MEITPFQKENTILYICQWCTFQPFLFQLTRHYHQNRSRRFDISLAPTRWGVLSGAAVGRKIFGRLAMFRSMSIELQRLFENLVELHRCRKGQQNDTSHSFQSFFFWLCYFLQILSTASKQKKSPKFVCQKPQPTQPNDPSTFNDHATTKPNPPGWVQGCRVPPPRTAEILHLEHRGVW